MGSKTNYRYRFLTWPVKKEEYPYVLGVVKQTTDEKTGKPLTMAGFFSRCVEAEIVKMAKEAGMEPREYLEWCKNKLEAEAKET